MKPAMILLAVLAAAALGGCSESLPGGDPADVLKTELRGYDAPIGVMMGMNEKPYWVQSALSGFRAAQSGDEPAKLETLRFNGGCTFPAPKPDELVEKVHVDRSEMQSTVYVASRAVMGERTNKYVENYQAGQDIVPLNIDDDRMGIVDVVVTETSKPIYLVIAYTSPTIFNIQLAEGARLARIALVGTGAAGVANVDHSVPMQVLNGQALNSCRFMPVRQPADHWEFVQNAKENPNLADALAQNFALYRAYSSWYRENFGISSEPDSIGAAGASHVLVGPLPKSLETRVKFKSLEGATVFLSRTDYVFAGLPKDYEQQMSDLIVQSATKLAGGDLNKLRPVQ